MATLSKDYNLYGRDINLRHYYNERRVAISLGGSSDTTTVTVDQTGAFFYLDTEDKSTSTYVDSYTLGEFLYRLHFFAQIPYPAGYYLSGFVAFFFLFAIITGIIVHWDKIISNFYVFRPWSKLKTLWTDAHTSLGVLGFPFQFVYALTGAFFMLKAIMVAPFVFSLYQGNEEKFYADLEYRIPLPGLSYHRLESVPALSGFVVKTEDRWPGFKITELDITNYGDKNMYLTLSGNVAASKKFNGLGKITYRVTDQNVIYDRNPLTNQNYLDGIKNVLYRLHFGDYAGVGLRIVSFIFGIISCFVILSGVMIWLVARNRVNIPPKRRRFNEYVAISYLSICLSLYPIIALAFILVKFYHPAGMPFLYRTFFISWLLLCLFFIIKRDNDFTLRWSLILSTIFGLSIPLVNGGLTGSWFWNCSTPLVSPMQFVDILWLLLAIVNLMVLYRLKVASIKGKE